MSSERILSVALIDAPEAGASEESRKKRGKKSSKMQKESSAAALEEPTSQIKKGEAPSEGEQIVDPSNIDPAEWLEEHGDYLFRYAFIRINSQETAEDLVQDTLLAAVRGAKNFQGRSTVRTWLVGILKNKIIDYLRRSSRKEKKEVLEEDNDTLDRHFNRFGIWNRVLPNWASEPSELLERKEFMAQFEKCLAKVPEKSRRAFMLKTFENVDTPEICKILDITPSNLWVLLHRCRLSLRECLEHNWANAEAEKKKRRG